MCIFNFLVKIVETKIRFKIHDFSLKFCNEFLTLPFFLGKFECDCPPEWNGYHCEIYDASFGGGIVNVLPSQDPPQKSLEEEKKMCIANACEEKERNNICDEECNSYACNFDGGDCSLGTCIM